MKLYHLNIHLSWRPWIPPDKMLPSHLPRLLLADRHHPRFVRSCPVAQAIIPLSDIPIERHIKVRGKASPDDPELAAYWQHRHTQYGKTCWTKGSKRRHVAENQHWHCPLCGEHLHNGEDLQTHHKIPIRENGSNKIDNLVILHRVCHQQLHQMSNPSGLLEA